MGRMVLGARRQCALLSALCRCGGLIIDGRGQTRYADTSPRCRACQTGLTELAAFGICRSRTVKIARVAQHIAEHDLVDRHQIFVAQILANADRLASQCLRLPQTASRREDAGRPNCKATHRRRGEFDSSTSSSARSASASLCPSFEERGATLSGCALRSRRHTRPRSP